MQAQHQKKTKRRRITFSFHASETQKVSLVGEFNNWDTEKHPMKYEGDGLWSKTILLAPGVYEYKFLADGNWMLDAKNDYTRPNRYGTLNNVITVSLVKK